MARKGKEPAADGAAAVRSLFAADNPFRRKDEPAPPEPAAPAAAAPLRTRAEPADAEPSAKDVPGRKRKRDDVVAAAAGYERRRLGAATEGPAPALAVGAKRKAPEEDAAAAGAGEEEAMFPTVQATVDAMPLGNRARTVIRLAPGVYREPVYVAKTRNLITLAAASPEATIISWDYNTATRTKHAQTSRVIRRGHSVVEQLLLGVGGDFIAENHQGLLGNDLHLDPAESVVISGFSSLLWLIKPLYGFIRGPCHGQ